MKSTNRFSVIVEKEELIFSAAHFITFNTNICESLHGHNYRVKCEIVGELDENGYVIDFILLRDELKKITQSLDHRTLLPTQHDSINVTYDEHEVQVVFEDRRWVFPHDDCVLLPLHNTTAEQLAGYIGGELIESLGTRLGPRIEKLIISVDENEGQWGRCEFVR